MSDHTGIAAVVHAAVWLDDQLGLEILFIGRNGLDRENSSTLEASGKHLAYKVVLDNTFVFLYVQLLDVVADCELLISVGDTKSGWETICKIVQALERNNVKSLERPIEAGLGPHGWVIA
jgi:hypothetical protein